MPNKRQHERPQPQFKTLEAEVLRVFFCGREFCICFESGLVKQARTGPAVPSHTTNAIHSCAAFLSDRRKLTETDHVIAGVSKA